jgi:hypothetical protein
MIIYNTWKFISFMRTSIRELTLIPFSKRYKKSEAVYPRLL